MFTLLFLLLQLQQSPASPAVVNGTGSPSVTIPRIEAAVRVDGQLDEEAWSRAVRLGGFSQYRPSDSRPAEERTEVLVWYSPTSIHFGIIAYDREPGSIRATVGDRDNLSSDDTVTIYLDTFDDRRRAFFFTVNPLGLQEDGVQTESGFTAGMMHGGMQQDKSPDYQFESKGRLTSEGYVVEVRIPFKSLRYGGSGPQRWGLNILRKVQRTGYEETWTDAKRVSSFLAQSGAIEGLHDLKRGVVTEIQPVLTTANNGTRNATTGVVVRDTNVQPGVNARFGFTNLSLDATVNPDFSQVESDAGLVTLNERFALFYAEKRPFFLEGIELFATPSQLVYTRQIANPVAGGKLTGKVGRTSVAYLIAQDDTSDGDPGVGSALFNVARVRRDLGADSTAGVTYTDRTTSAGYNRVLAADTRIVFKRLYYVQGQIGQAWTGRAGTSVSAPTWLAEADRTGRYWGFNFKLTAFGAGFESDAGYVPRTDIVTGHGSNRFTWYGARGAHLESITTFFGFERIWREREFPRRGPLEGNENLNLMFQMKGGWSIHGSVQRQFVKFEPQAYSSYFVAGAGGALVPYQPLPGLQNGYARSLSVNSGTYRRFDAEAGVEKSDVAIFDEASQGVEVRYSAGVSVRPSESIRLDATTTVSRITRARDGSEFARTFIPRLKAEYQPRPSLFFRVVAEYRGERRDALADARTGAPIFIGNVASAQESAGSLRVDYLVSYKPSPGTVAFFGYGSSSESPLVDRLWDVRRKNDGFFVKLAYLFRR
jgi:hypothetical protein